MSDVVNLRQARKRKARDQKRKAGDDNAAKHGRAKAEKSRTRAENALEARRLDGHRLADDATSKDGDPNGGNGPDGGR